MKIETIRISRLRSLREVEIPFNDYTCLVGSNGSGKSTVLCALNVFFRGTENTSTNLTRLSIEDFFAKSPEDPIEITVTFSDLNEAAREDFKHYIRHDKLIISARAEYNAQTGFAEVKQYGERLGIPSFATFFQRLAEGESVSNLKEIYTSLRAEYPELPSALTKSAMLAAVQLYEAEHPNACQPIRSEDQFYGFTKGSNKLQRYIQWVYVPAVKDACLEQVEGKNTALGRLLARTVRAKTNFAERIDELRRTLLENYAGILEQNQHALADLSTSLQGRLAEWAHPDTTCHLMWRQDPDRAVRIEEPWAQVIVGERGFEGEVTRLGHGVQRSYIIALLQELASLGGADGPTLLLGCEEPELYQHPPQARHLAEVLKRLSSGNAQAIVSTHSPYFVSGTMFEDVRVVRRNGGTKCTSISYTRYDRVSEVYTATCGKPLERRQGALAKMHQILQPCLNEMFFAPKIALVEGPEDVAYIHSYLLLSGRWDEFRRSGCCIVPVVRKSEIPRPLIVLKELGIPTLVVCDADADERDAQKREWHVRDNQCILRICGLIDVHPMPERPFWSDGLVMWDTRIGDVVEREIGKDLWMRCKEQADL